MKTETRIRVLVKGYEKSLANQKILNATAYDEICKEFEKLANEDADRYDDLVEEIGLTL